MNSEKSLLSIRQNFAQQTSTSQTMNYTLLVIKTTIISISMLFILVYSIDSFIEQFDMQHITMISISLLFLIIALLIQPRQIRIISNKVITCPHCLKNILIKNIANIICPYCDAENLTFEDVLYGCPHCGDPIRLIKCPHCDNDIDLDIPYDVEELKDNRYEEI